MRVYLLGASWGFIFQVTHQKVCNHKLLDEILANSQGSWISDCAAVYPRSELCSKGVPAKTPGDSCPHYRGNNIFLPDCLQLGVESDRSPPGFSSSSQGKRLSLIRGWTWP